MIEPLLAPRLPDGPFRVDLAITSGVTRSRLTRRDLVSPLHGVRAPVEYPVDIVEAVALVLRPDQFVSHVTAAKLWEAPLPIRLRDALVHVTSVGSAPIMRRPQVTPHRTRAGAPDVQIVNGVPISGPARCWFECASVLTVHELVVLGDYFVGPSGLATIDGLAAAITRNGRHATRARAALARVRAGVESPMESRMRLSVVDAGFPEPEVNVDVADPEGRFLGRVDLAWPELRIALEYDGDHHRGQEQYRRDQRRANGFSVNQWIVIHATAMDAERPSVVFERLRQAFVQRRLERSRAA